MIDPTHPRLSLVRQCALVAISRSSFYYEGTGETALNLALMRLIDAQFLETPYYGSRQMTRHLRRQGYGLSRKRIRRLMRTMGLTPIYQKPRTSAPHPDHRIYPYLLRDVPIDRPDHVLRRRHLHPDATRVSLPGRNHGLGESQGPGLAAVQLVGPSFCVEALSLRAAAIFNTDQGSQFTSLDFTQVLACRSQWTARAAGWTTSSSRTLKYECSISTFETGSETRRGLNRWVDDRPHSSLEDRTPDEAYRGIDPFTRTGRRPGSRTHETAA